MLFDVELITYHGLHKTIQTDKLNIPTSDGRRTILSNHMPIIIPLEVGVIETNNEGKLDHYAVSEGMVYFENNHAKIVCDVIENIRDVDVEIYKNKLTKAQENLQTARTDDDIKKAKIQLTRATNVIEAARKARN